MFLLYVYDVFEGLACNVNNSEKGMQSTHYSKVLKCIEDTKRLMDNVSKVDQTKDFRLYAFPFLTMGSLSHV